MKTIRWIMVAVTVAAFAAVPVLGFGEDSPAEAPKAEAAQRVLADGAYHDGIGTQAFQVVGNVERRATQEEAARQGIPEDFADADDPVAHGNKCRTGVEEKQRALTGYLVWRAVPRTARITAPTVFPAALPAGRRVQRPGVQLIFEESGLTIRR